MKINKLHKKISDKFEIARKYYNIVFDMNDIHITAKELDLVAFSATNGTMSTPPIREEYIKRFKVSKASMYNMIARLQKIKILMKDKEGKIRVNSQIHPDFNQKEFLIAIKIINNGN